MAAKQTKSTKSSSKTRKSSSSRVMRGSIPLNKKMFAIFLVPFILIGAFILLFSHAATDPKLANYFPADSTLFTHPAPKSSLQKPDGVHTVLGNSVNVAYPQTLWTGPGASFTYHKNGSNLIQACWRVRDMGQVLFGSYNDKVAANVTFAITSDKGTLATASPTLDWRYKDATIYGMYPYCISTGQLTDNTTYNNVNYTVTVNKGAINIQDLDIHGIDFTYTPSATQTTTQTNKNTSNGSSSNTNSSRNEVSCDAIGCPNTSLWGNGSSSSNASSYKLVQFSSQPATTYNPADVVKVANYIAAVDCAKQPLMYWDDTAKQCKAMDFSFVPVLIQQIGNYMDSLQQQANYAPADGGGYSGGGDGGYVQPAPPADPFAGLGFLNNIMCGIVPCGAYAATPTPSVSYCGSIGLPYNYKTGLCGV